jgi:hypothetical protein
MFDCVACPVADVVASPVLTSGGGSPPAPTGLVLEMQTTGAAETITLPITGSVDVTVDWGDGSSVENFTTDSPSHEYATADTYTIEVTGGCDAFGWGGVLPDRLKLLKVNRGGPGFVAGSWYRAFFRCTAVTEIDMTGADMSGATDFERFARDNGVMTTIDLTAMQTATPVFLDELLQSTASLTTIIGVEGFNVTALTNAQFMLTDSGLSTPQYDAALVNYEAQSVQNNVIIGFGASTYTIGSAADTARTALANDHSWTITDGGGV